MIVDGFLLAALTGGAFYFLYRKMPRKVRKFLQKHILLTDTVACLLTYMLFGGTLVALFAAAWMSLIISMLLVLVRNPTAQRVMETIAQKIIVYKNQVAQYIEEKFPPEEENAEEKNCSV